MPSIRFVFGLCACVCILCFVGHASAASGVYWTKSYPLQQGQAVIHQVQVDNSALFALTSPPRAQFALYAVQIPIAGAQNCPPEAAIRNMASYISQNTLVLPRGQWCVEVYAAIGSGTYFLEASSVVTGPSPPTAPIPMLSQYSPGVNPTLSVPFKYPSSSFTRQPVRGTNPNFFHWQVNR
ncbi:MAG: hypothetical protein LBV40_08535 [Methanomicrobiales archaeon]|nr:hypothetical protein [Methanomicrobiales archaeon]